MHVTKNGACTCDNAAHDVINEKERKMLTVSPYEFKGTPKTCAGCGQAFVIREGRSEAIVGDDGLLYCFGTACEQEAFPATQLLWQCA